CSVYPSACALAVRSIAMSPVPPGRLATMKERPMRSVSFCATARAVRSIPPPGALPSSTRTGLGGYPPLPSALCCAWAPHATAAASSGTATNFPFIIVLPPPVAAAALHRSRYCIAHLCGGCAPAEIRRERVAGRDDALDCPIDAPRRFHRP